MASVLRKLTIIAIATLSIVAVTKNNSEHYNWLDVIPESAYFVLKVALMLLLTFVCLSFELVLSFH